MTTTKLKVGTKLAYGISDIAGSGIFTLLAFVLMNYLTNHVGLNPALAGTALMLGKIFDAAADPIVGYLSDRTHTRLGRRRPWMLAGAVVMVIGLLVLLNNPHIQDQTLLFLWAAGAAIIVNLAFALLNIPYSALSAEMTADFNERTSLNGYRMVFAVVGSFIGAGASMPIVGLFNDAAGKATDTGYLVLGAVFAGVVLIVTLVTVLGVKEKTELAGTIEKNILKSYAKAFKNKAFLLVLIPFIMFITAQSVVSGTVLYFFEDIYHAKELNTIAMVILLTTTMVFVPVWVALSKVIGKRLALSIGMFIIAAVGFVGFFTAHLYGPTFFFVLMFVAGIGLAAAYVLPWAILPDAIDAEYAETGERREGPYYGIWTFTSKIGQALAAQAIGITLAVTQYVPNAPQQTELAQLGIRFLFGPVMGLCYLIGAIVILFYPITKAKYEEIRAKIEARDGK